MSSPIVERADGWVAATALGTISLAVVTVVAIVVTAVISRLDRRRADGQASEDRKAARDLAADQRRHELNVIERGRIVDLLLRLGAEVAKSTAGPNTPQSAAAVQQILMLLRALPPDCAVFAREIFNVRGTDGQWDGPSRVKFTQQIAALGGRQSSQLNSNDASIDIAGDIARYRNPLPE